jgi:hypothetical protein
MDRGNAAEWLLCQVMSAERASELVGDILESKSNDEHTKFWGSIASLMIAFSWRTILGLFLSPFVSTLLAWLMLSLIITSNANTSPSRHDLSAQMYLFGISILLWEATVISLVRFKLRSAYVAVALAASLVCTVAAYCLFATHHLSTIICVGAIFLVFSASNRMRFKALGALLCTITISWLAAYGISEIDHSPNSIFSGFASLTALLVIPFVENSSTSFFCDKFLNQGNVSD